MTQDYAALTATELLVMAKGCTEHTCLYHGRINRELANRRLEMRRLAEQGAAK